MTVTVTLILLILAAVALGVHAIWQRCPLWVSVLFILVIELLRILPK